MPARPLWAGLQNDEDEAQAEFLLCINGLHGLILLESIQ